MKVKLIAREARYPVLEAELRALGIEIDENADLILQEADAFAGYLMCRKEAAMYRIAVEEILFIESLQRDILVHTESDVYKTEERLWQLERQLDPCLFLRVSNSVIVAKRKIQKIQPALSQKFVLTLLDGSRVDVTRTYYYAFREAMEI